MKTFRANRKIPEQLSLIACSVFLFFSGCSISHRQPAEGRSPIVFTFRGDHRSVCLSGDFNAWATDAHCLERDEDKWKIEVSLPPGRYRYGFIVDGSRWVTDPMSLLLEQDGFGKENSVIVVE